ncbi:Uncharacterised protein [Mycobacteroides abscessus subsp. abscessus]|nr:Uncharacterised protein [Mycobacteroides abscessus subsp. abscessus]
MSILSSTARLGSCSVISAGVGRGTVSCGSGVEFSGVEHPASSAATNASAPNRRAVPCIAYLVIGTRSDAATGRPPRISRRPRRGSARPRRRASRHVRR